MGSGDIDQSRSTQVYDDMGMQCSGQVKLLTDLVPW